MFTSNRSLLSENILITFLKKICGLHIVAREMVACFCNVCVTEKNNNVKLDTYDNFQDG